MTALPQRYIPVFATVNEAQIPKIDSIFSQLEKLGLEEGQISPSNLITGRVAQKHMAAIREYENTTKLVTVIADDKLLT